jgi:putative transposase
VALGINLELGRPGHPQDNAAHERLHRDISRELECLSQEVTQDALDLWRHEFNYQRPHESLAMRCPGELYHNSTRKYPGSIEELLYEEMTTRRVNQKGLIRWKDQSLEMVKLFWGQVAELATACTMNYAGRTSRGFVDRP